MSRGRSTSATARRPIALIDAAIAEMKQQGAVIVDPADIPTAARPRRLRVRGSALRVQGGPQRLPREAGARLRRSIRSRISSPSTRASPLARCRSSARKRCRGREEGAAHLAGVPQGAHNLPNAVARRRHRCGHDTAAPRRDRRADGQPGLDHRPRRTAITSSARVRRRRRSPGIRASPCRPASRTGCPSGCRSSDGRGARPG